MIDRLERLLNLVIALRETGRPLLASEIRERVAGYGQPDAEAFRRMFERDKADLRALGVPVQSAPLDRWDDRVGYRIDPAAYDLPPVRLEPGELAALALALSATGLEDEAGTGLRKLEVDAALDPHAPEEPPPIAVPHAPVGVRLEAPHRLDLLEAQITRTPVRFAYAPYGRPARTRTVDPYALVHRAGRWYLVGRDHERDARRAFRLDRIEGPVRPAGAGGSFHPPEGGVGTDDVVPRSEAREAHAEVLATRGIAWAVARRALGGGRPGRPSATGDPRTAFTVPVGYTDAFVGWALEHGPDLEVVGPPDLRAEVVARLRAVLEGGDQDGEGHR